MKKHCYAVCLLLLLLLWVTGCGQKPPPVTPLPTIAETETAVSPTKITPTSTPMPTATPNWWDEAIFYEIFVRSFADSDGDGVGDLNGLIANLDYLNDGDPTTDDDLGVTAIWLMPIMQSPSYHGYDVADYYQIDDEYGTNEDFQRLISEAHARGIRVIVDLVMNHTSNQNAWFQDALDSNSEKRDWYLWADEPADRWYATNDGTYYYGYFSDRMPDLNYENPDVTVAMQEVIRFWLEDMGVDGFRLDAIKHLLEDGPVLENTPATHQWLSEQFYPYYKSINPEAFTVGEVWSTTDDILPYIGDEVDIAFEFSLATAILDSAVSERKVNIERTQTAVINTYPPGQYATFLANHDQNRARSVLLNDEQAKIAATLQLMSPGVPFIYYGEEIGMQGTKPDENIRRPLQWNSEGGFSEAEPWRPYFEDVAERNIAGQNNDPDSLLSHYRTLIRLRTAYPALRTGGWQMVTTDHKAVYAFLRFTADETLLVLLNLGRKPVDVYNLALAEGPLTETAVLQPTLLMGSGNPSPPTINELGGFANYQPLPLLEPYSSTIIRFDQ